MRNKTPKSKNLNMKVRLTNVPKNNLFFSLGQFFQLKNVQRGYFSYILSFLKVLIKNITKNLMKYDVHHTFLNLDGKCFWTGISE